MGNSNNELEYRNYRKLLELTKNRAKKNFLFIQKMSYLVKKLLLTLYYLWKTSTTFFFIQKLDLDLLTKLKHQLKSLKFT